MTPSAGNKELGQPGGTDPFAAAQSTAAVDVNAVTVTSLKALIDDSHDADLARDVHRVGQTDPLHPSDRVQTVSGLPLPRSMAPISSRTESGRIIGTKGRLPPIKGRPVEQPYSERDGGCADISSVYRDGALPSNQSAQVGSETDETVGYNRAYMPGQLETPEQPQATSKRAEHGHAAPVSNLFGNRTEPNEDERAVLRANTRLLLEQKERIARLMSNMERNGHAPSPSISPRSASALTSDAEYVPRAFPQTPSIPTLRSEANPADARQSASADHLDVDLAAEEIAMGTPAASNGSGSLNAPAERRGYTQSPALQTVSDVDLPTAAAERPLSAGPLAVAARIGGAVKTIDEKIKKPNDIFARCKKDYRYRRCTRLAPSSPSLSRSWRSLSIVTQKACGPCRTAIFLPAGCFVGVVLIAMRFQLTRQVRSNKKLAGPCRLWYYLC